MTDIAVPLWVKVNSGTVQSIDWAISSKPFAGLYEGYGAATAFRSTPVPSPAGYYGVDNVTIETFPVSVDLPKGTYWLQLSATSSSGTAVYWDVAEGGFAADQGEQYEYGTGFGHFHFTPSFQILGQQVSATPLPPAMPLFASGICFLGLLGSRKKPKAKTAT